MTLTPIERARRITRLRTISERFLHEASLVENGDNTAAGGDLAMERKRDAWAVEWALEQVIKLNAKGE